MSGNNPSSSSADPASARSNNSLHGSGADSSKLSSFMQARIANTLRVRADRARDTVQQKSPWKNWYYTEFRPKTEEFLEDAGSSIGAYIFQLTIMFCIAASTVSFCTETLPGWRRYKEEWFQLEMTFIVIFTFEYVLRFTVTRKEVSKFVFEPMNFIDLLSMLPFYITLIASNYLPFDLDLRWLRVFRLMRIFKLGRHSEDLQFIFEGLAGSTTSFVLLGFLLFLALVFFSFLLYIFEQGEWVEEKMCFVRPGEPHFTGCSPFQNVPQSFWWAITTLTTVGYGDAFPITVGGKVICGFSMVCGILCVALPTTQLGVEFANLYEKGATDRREAVARKAMMNCTGQECKLLDLLKRYERYREQIKTQVPYIRQLIIVTKQSAGEEMSEFTEHKTFVKLAEQLDTTMNDYKDFVLQNCSEGKLEGMM